MDAISKHHLDATFERIASHTVGIASDENTGVGAGTLVIVDGQNFILTAKHVLGSSSPDQLRFWLRPPVAMREKAAKDTTNREVGEFTMGTKLPILDAQLDEIRDIAALRLDPKYSLPEGPQFYDMRRSAHLAGWNEETLDGLSLLMFGFPTDNSREVRDGKQTFMFTGCAAHVSNYSAELNTKIWGYLTSKFSRDKHFAFEYDGGANGYRPRGFSGGGIWIVQETQGAPIWTPDPILIGVAHKWIESRGAVISLKLSAFLEAERVEPAPPDTANKQP